MATLTKYCLKIWLTAAVCGPAVFYLSSVDAINSEFLTAIIPITIFGSLIGGIISIPSFLLLWFTAHCIFHQTRLDHIETKMLLTIAGILFTALPFLFFDAKFIFDFHGETFRAAASYSLIIVAGIWFYKLTSKEVLISTDAN